MHIPTSSSPLPLDGPQWIRFRQQEELRKAMLERRFDEVERIVEALEAAWWQTGDVPDDRYLYLATSSGLFDHASVDAARQLELLNDCARSHPDSYHAQYILGHHYFRRAGDIRTAAWVSDVGEDQWVAAHMACVTAAEHLLESNGTLAAPGTCR